MKKISYVLLLLIIFVSGCRQDIPQPDVLNAEASDKKQYNITMKHFVQGKDVLIECIAPDFSFSGKNKKGKQGKFLVYVDEQLYGEYETAAFVVKNLDKGAHHVKVELVNPSLQSYGWSRDFVVSIP